MSIYNEDIKFKIVNIKTERTPKGFTTISFITADDSMVEDVMIIKMPNCIKDDKVQIRIEMLAEYNKVVQSIEKKENRIKIGDLI